MILDLTTLIIWTEILLIATYCDWCGVHLLWGTVNTGFTVYICFHDLLLEKGPIFKYLGSE